MYDSHPPQLLLILIALPLVFALLCDTAEIFMSPTMALLSQAIPGLQPRVAGGGLELNIFNAEILGLDLPL